MDVNEMCPGDAVIVDVKQLVPGDQVVLFGTYDGGVGRILSVHKSTHGGHAWSDDAFANRNWHSLFVDDADSFLCTVVSVALVRMLTTAPDLRVMYDSIGFRCYPDDVAALLFVTGVTCTDGKCLMSNVPPCMDVLERFWGGLPFALVIDNPKSVQVMRVSC